VRRCAAVERRAFQGWRVLLVVWGARPVRSMSAGG